MASIAFLILEEPSTSSFFSSGRQGRESMKSHILLVLCAKSRSSCDLVSTFFLSFVHCISITFRLFVFESSSPFTDLSLLFSLYMVTNSFLRKLFSSLIFWKCLIFWLGFIFHSRSLNIFILSSCSLSCSFSDISSSDSFLILFMVCTSFLIAGC